MKSFKTFLALLALTALVSAQGFAAAPDAKDAAATAAPAKNWSERCDKAQKDQGPKRGRCEIFQSLALKKTGQRLMEFAISYPKDKKVARGVVIAPLGILLPAGLTMKIDDNQPFKFQPRYCDGNGCYSYIDLDDQIMATLKKGKKITVSFETTDQKNINVEMSLQDFAPALADIS